MPICAQCQQSSLEPQKKHTNKKKTFPCNLESIQSCNSNQLVCVASVYESLVQERKSSKGGVCSVLLDGWHEGGKKKKVMAMWVWKMQWVPTASLPPVWLRAGQHLPSVSVELRFLLRFQISLCQLSLVVVMLLIGCLAYKKLKSIVIAFKVDDYY